MKFAYNTERDERNYNQLRKLGWNVIIIWECEIRHGDAQKALQELKEKIEGVYVP